MKRTFSLALSLTLLISMTAGCANEEPDPAETKETDGETSAGSAAETEALTVAYEKDQLPSELSFEGETVQIFGWTSPSTAEFYVESENGDIVNDAIFERNRTVEERLNVNLEYRLEPGGWGDKEAWVRLVSDCIMAGDGAYDIAAGYSMCGASLAYKRLLTDLNTLEYIDFSKPWWPSSLQEEAVCDGRLYFCSGDISTYMIYYLYGVYFNKQLLREYDLEDPYVMVNDGIWTLDKMMEMSSAIYQDINADGKKGEGDLLGTSCSPVFIDPFYFASGLRTTEKDKDGIPVISSDFNSEKTVELAEKLSAFFSRQDAYLYEGLDSFFSEGRSLFSVGEFIYAVDALRNSEIEYGIVPMPKYDVNQEEYYTIMSFPYSLYGVPVDAKDPDRSAAVLECLASESYRKVSPVLFEVGYKTKYASDPDSSQMFDLIRSSVVFDIGRIFNDSMGGLTYQMFRETVYTFSHDWASRVAKNEKKMNKMLERVVDALLED